MSAIMTYVNYDMRRARALLSRHGRIKRVALIQNRIRRIFLVRRIGARDEGNDRR